MNAPIFTRYLYYEPDVVVSLMTALLKKQPERALFWAYELYFSGLESKLFRLLSLLYKKYYAPINTKKWGAFLESKMREWAESRWMHCLVASIVHTMALRPSLPDPNVIGKGSTYYIHYTEKDIEPYLTLLASPAMRSYRILKQVCLYSTEKKVDIRGFEEILEDLSVSILYDETRLYRRRFEMGHPGGVSLQIVGDIRPSEDSIFVESSKDDVTNHEFFKGLRASLLEKYFYHWDYYSFFTPIWKERIEKRGGRQDPEKKGLIFPDEESEDAYYLEYGYEPDEQPAEITERTV